MKRMIVIIFCLLCVLAVNSVTYEPYTTTYDYIPFESTSPLLQTVNYNTVKPLNADGTVSMDYTTYKGVYRPRRNGLGGIGEDDDPIAQLDDSVPIGDPDIIVICMLLFSYFVFEYTKKSKSEGNTSLLFWPF